MSKADQRRKIDEVGGCQRCTSWIHKEQQCRWWVAQPVRKGARHRDHDHLARDAVIEALGKDLSAMDKRETTRGVHRPQAMLASSKQTPKNEESCTSTTRASTGSKSNKCPVCHQLQTYTHADNKIVTTTLMSSCSAFNIETEIARGRLVREAGGCKQCKNWQHSAKYCQKVKVKAARCGIRDGYGIECTSMHHPSISR